MPQQLVELDREIEEPQPESTGASDAGEPHQLSCGQRAQEQAELPGAKVDAQACSFYLPALEYRFWSSGCSMHHPNCPVRSWFMRCWEAKLGQTTWPKSASKGGLWERSVKYFQVRAPLSATTCTRPSNSASDVRPPMFSKSST